MTFPSKNRTILYPPLWKLVPNRTQTQEKKKNYKELLGFKFSFAKIFAFAMYFRGQKKAQLGK